MAEQLCASAAASFLESRGKMPPPPFAPFWRNMLFFAAWFGCLWGVFMWFSTWQSEGYSALDALFASVTAGGLFGFLMALFHAWRKRATSCRTGIVFSDKRGRLNTLDGDVCGAESVFYATGRAQIASKK